MTVFCMRDRRVGKGMDHSHGMGVMGCRNDNLVSGAVVLIDACA